MSSRHQDNPDARKKKSALDQLVGNMAAAAWITMVGSITYGVLMFTDLLPPEMRLAALDQMINPDKEEATDPEDVVKAAGLDPESLATLAMAAQTLGNTNLGLAATEIMEDYDEDAFALMQQMEIKGGEADYLAMLSQLPDDVIDTEMTEDEALAVLAEHSAAMAEMQALLEEKGMYAGPVDGLDDTGDIESTVAMMETMADSASAEGETAAATGQSATRQAMGDSVEVMLQEAGFLVDPDETIKAMTDTAVETLLDEQRYTVPMLDTETTNIEKIRDYQKLLDDPETMLGGETDESVHFIKAYMLPHTLLDDAIAYRESGQTDRALNALRLIFLAFPDHRMTGDALLLLSDIQDSQGETAASVRTLRTFLSVHGGHPRISDGVVRYSDWQIVSGDGLPAACEWLARVSAYPPAIHARGLEILQRAARQRGCHGAPVLRPSIPTPESEPEVAALEAARS